MTYSYELQRRVKWARMEASVVLMMAHLVWFDHIVQEAQAAFDGFMEVVEGLNDEHS